LGGIHLLINNAGGGGGGRQDLFKIDLGTVNRAFELNVFSGWRLASSARPT